MKPIFWIAGAALLAAGCNNDAERVEELEDRLARMEQQQKGATPQGLVGGTPSASASAAPATGVPGAGGAATGPTGRIDPARVNAGGSSSGNINGNVCNDGIDRYLVVNNNSGQTLRYFYASPPTVDDWEEDILGSDVVMNGDSYRINFNTDNRCTCTYDTKAVFADESEEVGTANVCTARSITYR